MGQFFFFAIFLIALLAGAFAYFSPSQQSINPMKFVMEESGFNYVDQQNHKKSETLNLKTSNGLLQVRRQMNELAEQQEKFLSMIRDQQQVLESSGKQATDIMRVAQSQGEAGREDILRLKALSEEMRDEQRLLIAHGKDLLVLNEQLLRTRQWVADQMDAANIDNQASLNSLKERYAVLKYQAAGFFDRVSQHNQEVSDQMQRLKDKMNSLSNNSSSPYSSQLQNTNANIQQMLNQARDNMSKIEDSQQKTREIVNDAHQKYLDSKSQLDDSLQRSQDMIEQEREKAADQKWINQQRMADQLQRMRDQQNK